MKKGLVLSGGSIKGAFQAGAISYLLQHGYQPEGLFGISAGALNSAFLASRAGGQLKAGQAIDWPEIGQALEAFWRERVTKFSSIARKKPYPLFDAIFDRFDGMILPDGLKGLLQEAISEENVIEFSKGGRLFSVGAVDVWSGQIIYSEQMNYRNLLDHVLASASIPPIFPVVKITVGVSMAFVDGGIRDIVPLQRAIKNGFTDLTVVVCQPRDYVGSGYPIPGSVIKHVERLIDILLTEVIDNDLEHTRKFIELASSLPKEVIHKHNSLSAYFDMPEPRVIRPDSIEPALEVDLMDFNSTQIAKMIEVGKDAARNARP